MYPSSSAYLAPPQSFQAKRSSAGTATSVTVIATSTIILNGNVGRIGATIVNSGPVVVYIALGFTPTTASYTVSLLSGQYYEVPFNFAGIINGITGSSGTVLVTELT
jgi:aconitase B